MSKYNSYARALNDAFRTASDNYAAALARKDKVMQESQPVITEWVNGRRAATAEAAALLDAKKQAANAAVAAANQAFKREIAQIMSDYSKATDDLTAAIRADVHKQNAVNPDDIDGNALALLTSGIMTANDYEQMYSKYAENLTMKRLIGKYAHDAADGTPTHDDAQKLSSIYTDSTTGIKDTLDAWDAICESSKIYVGSRRPESPAYVQHMQRCWNDNDEIQQSIDTF